MENHAGENQLTESDNQQEGNSSAAAKYVGFLVGNNEYCVPVDVLHEIIPYRTITPLPQAPKGIIGIIDWRGRIINVLDIFQRLGIKEADDRRGSRILITKVPRITAIIVKNTTSLIDINLGDCSQPDDNDNEAIVYSYSQNEKVIKILNINKLLDTSSESGESNPGGENDQ